MTHLNMVPEEMGFVLCFETGNLINWYWISGVRQMEEGPGWDLASQPPGEETLSPRIMEAALDSLCSGLCFVKTVL